MPLVPLGTQAYKRAGGPVPETKCYNFYLEKDGTGVSPDGTLRIQRPGMSVQYNIAAPVRAIAFNPANAHALMIGAATLYDNGISKGSVGVASFKTARIVVTQLNAGIYNEGEIYLYDGATITAVTLPDDAGSFPVDIEQINGYFIVLLGSGRFYWIVPGETTIDPLNFATAESSNDNALAVRQVGDEFWIFGSRTIEPWQATGNLDLPFQPASGRIIPHGCLHGESARHFDNTVVWVGDDCNVYRGGAVAQVISTPAISERIRRRSGIISGHSVFCTAWDFTVDDHSFYALYVPGQGTFSYDASTQAWSQWATAASTTWPYIGDSYQGFTLTGGLDSGKVYRVDAELTSDDGVAFSRIVTGTVPFIGRPPRNVSLSVGVVASANCSLRIRWRDGQDDYPDLYEELDVRAPFDIVTLYRLGAPAQPYREFELSVTDDVRVSVVGCAVNEGWQ